MILLFKEYISVPIYASWSKKERQICFGIDRPSHLLDQMPSGFYILYQVLDKYMIVYAHKTFKYSKTIYFITSSTISNGLIANGDLFVLILS